MRIFSSDNDPIDVCDCCVNSHSLTEGHAFNRWGNQGDGPDGRGNCFSYDTDHPDYDDGDYTCRLCGTQLIEGTDSPAHGHG